MREREKEKSRDSVSEEGGCMRESVWGCIVRESALCSVCVCVYIIA